MSRRSSVPERQECGESKMLIGELKVSKEATFFVVGRPKPGRYFPHPGRYPSPCPNIFNNRNCSVDIT